MIFGSFKYYPMFRKSSLSWKSKNAVHLVISLLGSISLGSGFWAIYENKNINIKPHFTSWHGKISLISIILIILLVCNGLLTYFGVKSSRILHRKFSLMISCLFFTAFSLGLYSNWAQNNLHFSALLTSLCIPLIAALTMKSRAIYQK